MAAALVGLPMLLGSMPSALAQDDIVVAQAPAATQRPPAVRAAIRATKPLWNELSAAQHQALAPLADHWNQLSETQKRKWIVMSRNYSELPLSEQVLLHGRMDAWVALSPQQRRAARTNFAETKRMSADEKQEKWEAYQALSPDDRRKFTDTATRPARGAAGAITPVPRKKLANIAAEPSQPSRLRIAQPGQIDPRTLLPQPGATSTLLPRQNSR
ncbi:MAG: DUF3106 domain-containing protein [Burkholderiales bacterium]